MSIGAQNPFGSGSIARGVHGRKEGRFVEGMPGCCRANSHKVQWLCPSWHSSGKYLRGEVGLIKKNRIEQKAKEGRVLAVSSEVGSETKTVKIAQVLCCVQRVGRVGRCKGKLSVGFGSKGTILCANREEALPNK